MNAQTRSVIAWVIVGLIAGWVASLIARATGTTALEWIIAGLIGAVVGGFVAQQLRINLKTGNRFLERLILAVVGAIVVIAIATVII
jgi:uncharacterized membrane protein YeaQ/YmgE (transglycosylase-associated protein family)